MGTRGGDIDPGAILFLLQQGMSVKALHQLLEKHSGLLGVSGYSSDLRDIILAAGHPVAGYEPARRPTLFQRRQSRIALQLFIYRLQKYIAGYAGILERVDAVVFTGAAGERNAWLRREIMSGLHLSKRYRILAVPTREEQEMVHSARSLLR